jgi:hypothetical protein
MADLRRRCRGCLCANNGATTTEARIMLAQAALEYLGWVT